MDDEFIKIDIDKLAEKVAEKLQRPAEERLLTVKGAAKYIGRSATAVYGMIQRGKLTPVKNDGRRMLDRLDLDAWIEAGKEA